MELKCIWQCSSDDDGKGSNRTFMELKYCIGIPLPEQDEF